MMKKRIVAATMAALMALSLTACGGSSDSGSSSGSGVSITIFNSKSEIQDAFEEMAAEYSEATGVDVEVYYSSDTVSAHLSTKYASNDPYTIAMVDAKDVYSLGSEHAIDLSDEDWVSNTDYAITVDGEVKGFPVCIEARGLMYNASAIEAITGETFNPSDYETLSAFKGLLDQLVAGGMEAPVGIMKEDWSLAAHFFQEIYEEQDDPEAFVQSLYAGTADLANNTKFNSLMDTFDTLMAYNYAKDSAIAAEREVSEQKLAEGEIAFMFGGNWDWSMINAYDYTDGLGMMPVPQDTDDGSNTKLVGGGSKYFFIDSADSITEEQRQAAKDFLNWLVSDADGNAFLTEKCAVVPAFSNIDASALDPLSTSVKEYADAGNLIPNYDYDPDDHYSIVGASMQKYLAGQIDRAGFAAEVEDYWSSTTPVEH
jgi:raffinose/stachyose/melibiose transport system substrate-binding protein